MSNQIKSNQIKSIEVNNTYNGRNFARVYILALTVEGMFRVLKTFYKSRNKTQVKYVNVASPMSDLEDARKGAVDLQLEASPDLTVDIDGMCDKDGADLTPWKFMDELDLRLSQGLDLMSALASVRADHGVSKPAWMDEAPEAPEAPEVRDGEGRRQELPEVANSSGPSNAQNATNAEHATAEWNAFKREDVWNCFKDIFGEDNTKRVSRQHHDGRMFNTLKTHEVVKFAVEFGIGPDDVMGYLKAKGDKVQASQKAMPELERAIMMIGETNYNGVTNFEQALLRADLADHGLVQAVKNFREQHSISTTN